MAIIRIWFPAFKPTHFSQLISWQLVYSFTVRIMSIQYPPYPREGTITFEQEEIISIADFNLGVGRKNPSKTDSVNPSLMRRAGVVALCRNYHTVLVTICHRTATSRSSEAQKMLKMTQVIEAKKTYIQITCTNFIWRIERTAQRMSCIKSLWSVHYYPETFDTSRILLNLCISTGVSQRQWQQQTTLTMRTHLRQNPALNSAIAAPILLFQIVV